MSVKFSCIFFVIFTFRPIFGIENEKEMVEIFKNVSNVLILSTENDSKVMENVEFFINLNKTLMVFKLKFENDKGNGRKIDKKFIKSLEANEFEGYFIMTDRDTFVTQMTQLIRPTGTYLIDLGSEKIYDQILMDFYHEIWQSKGAYKVFISSTQANEKFVITFDPFLVDPKTKTHGKLVNYGSRRLQNIFRNLNGYHLKVDIFRSIYSAEILGPNKKVVGYYGADVNVVQAMAQYLNFTITKAEKSNLNDDGFGSLQKDGSFSGAIGRILNHSSDIAFTTFFVKDYLTHDIEFTVAVHQDEMCVMVKKASKIPESLLPLSIFEPELWALYFGMGIIFALAWIFIRFMNETKVIMREHRNDQIKYCKKHKCVMTVDDLNIFNIDPEIEKGPAWRKIVQIFIDSFILLLSAPYLRFPKISIERFFLSTILIVSLIMVSMWQSYLSSVLVNPVYYRDISTLQELDDKGYKIPIKYLGYLDDVFPINSSQVNENLRKKMYYTNTKDKLMDRVYQKGNLATITRKSTTTMDNAIYLMKMQVYLYIYREN